MRQLSLTGPPECSGLARPVFPKAWGPISWTRAVNRQPRKNNPGSAEQRVQTQRMQYTNIDTNLRKTSASASASFVTGPVGKERLNRASDRKLKKRKENRWNKLGYST